MLKKISASIKIQLENWRLELHSHPLEINFRFTHNHVIDSSESLSFQHVKEEVHERFLELFRDGYSPVSAIYTYKDGLHITESDQELLEILADRAINPDYGYVIRLSTIQIMTEQLCKNSSASFDSLNTSIILLYMSYAADALPLGVLITLDELEITLEKGVEYSFPHTFYGRGPQVRPMVFFTDDSSAE
ncbi:hypothetical protein RhiirA5_405823 [Rhizophagus irregularis]|uniref:Uncharacterized protein n=1 Tax=Rhizophagus irregularis TaxID=588596 RepID=A0A2N0RTX2_9GLOM|nr:hypothetical protein RhiirA5_405823 [Rhizophagus irregularis]PKC66757.1 hypothetical protein RhiirA1_459306 [Rhizophagus irregularis]